MEISMERERETCLLLGKKLILLHLRVLRHILFMRGTKLDDACHIYAFFVSTEIRSLEGDAVGARCLGRSGVQQQDDSPMVSSSNI